MAPSCYDVAASMLLCAEDNVSIMDFDEAEVEEEPIAAAADFGADLFPPQSEECVAGLVERESEHMPRPDYGERLLLAAAAGCGGGVDLRVRSEAVDWIWKVRFFFSPDRFVRLLLPCLLGQSNTGKKGKILCFAISPVFCSHD